MAEAEVFGRLLVQGGLGRVPTLSPRCEIIGDLVGHEGYPTSGRAFTPRTLAVSPSLDAFRVLDPDDPMARPELFRALPAAF